MGTTTFSGPVVSTNGFVGSITGDVVGAIKLPTYTVANAPSAATAARALSSMCPMAQRVPRFSRSLMALTGSGRIPALPSQQREVSYDN